MKPAFNPGWHGPLGLCLFVFMGVAPLGQKAHTVFVHVIMAQGTADERQYEALQTKGITERIRVRKIHLAT
jgi:hypothetical protein